MKIVVVGDAGTSAAYFAEMASRLPYDDKEIISLQWEPPLDEIQQRLLNIEKNGPESEPYPAGLEEAVADADMLLVHVCPVPRRIIEMGKKLKIIGACRNGLENIDVDAATSQGITVFHVVRNAEPVADFTLGLILAETRNIARSHEAICQGRWLKKFSNSPYITTLRELRVGLVGIGHIGKLVAHRLLALDVQVLGCDPFMPKEALSQLDSRISLMSIEEVFEQSDVVSLHLRLTPQSEGIIDEALIKRMKPSSYLINTSRAGILKEQPFIDALQSKQIAGAALDVFWEEPLPSDHPLLSMDNVTLTSHIAGDTVDAIPKSPKLLIEVLCDYLQNGTRDFIVNG